MIRKVVHIDQDKCNGCGLCVPSCAEGAIEIVDGKARLAADRYCDGLGACLGECPRGAITVIEREAEAFDEEAVKARLSQPGRFERILAEAKAQACGATGGGCPGSRAMTFAPPAPSSRGGAAGAEARPSRLAQWPVQLHLLNPAAAYFKQCDLLLAADCVAFAMPDFHERFLDGKTVAVACPKLDDTQPYVGKLAEILAANDVRSLTVAIMEVPCCGGLERIAREALRISGRAIPFQTRIVSLRGETD